MKVALLNDWEGKTPEESIIDFYGSRWCFEEEAKAKKEEFLKESLAGVEWIFGSYSYVDYSGEAFVLFKKGNQVLEVNGSHCSCYGLEGQWSPEPTTIEAIKSRIEKGSLGSSYYKENEFKESLITFLQQVEE